MHAMMHEWSVSMVCGAEGPIVMWVKQVFRGSMLGGVASMSGWVRAEEYCVQLHLNLFY